MYKIMLADDEGIVIESISHIIKKNFGESCIIKSAKTGRSVIELAEEFRPNIAFIDIQMPGINGIDAMKEIKKVNSSIIFIVISAYDKFVYAKEAIQLGVLDYLTKPTNKDKIIASLDKAMKLVDEEREKRNKDLIIKEKLETVVPVIESGLIYTILFQENYIRETDNFKQLLGIEENYGFILMIQYGDMNEKGDMTNPVGVSVKALSFYSELREITKEFFDAVVGPIMVNQVVTFIPWKDKGMEYDDRIKVIEKARNLKNKLKRHIDLDFRIGIGSVKELEELTQSYKEAIVAIRHNERMVTHIKDISKLVETEKEYHTEIEQSLIQLIKKGNFARVRGEASTYFDWLVSNYNGDELDLQTKIFEITIHIEDEAFSSGVKEYHFRYRGDYLKTLMRYKKNEELKAWFLGKISEICRNVMLNKEEQSNGIIIASKDYIEKCYHKGISLEDVSREVDISPYYFSKLFKEKTGEKFIDYLTNIRIEKAKELLMDKELSMKEICIKVGYGDPNYFSRIFKKCEGKTPTDYREGIF